MKSILKFLHSPLVAKVLGYAGSTLILVGRTGGGHYADLATALGALFTAIAVHVASNTTTSTPN